MRTAQLQLWNKIPIQTANTKSSFQIRYKGLEGWLTDEEHLLLLQRSGKSQACWIHKPECLRDLDTAPT